MRTAILEVLREATSRLGSDLPKEVSGHNQGRTPMPLRLLGRTIEPILARAAREVLLQLNQPCLLLAPEGRVVLANSWFREAFLGAGEEPEGASLFAIAGGAFDTPEVHALLDEAGRIGAVQQRPLAVTFPSRGSRALVVGITPIRGRTFKSPLTVFAIQDETDRVRLADERTRLVQAVDHARDAIVMTDAAGFISYANPAFEATTGIRPADAVGALATTVLQLSSRALAPLVTSVRRQGYWAGVISGWRTDGGAYEVEVLASAVRDADGRTAGYVAVGRDLTRERILERRIETERADRARVAFALARLHPMAAAEEAAAAVCDELYRLPWVDAAAIVNLTPWGAVIPIAVNAPLGAPLRRDVALTAGMAARLRERLASGPWVDDLAVERLAGGADHSSEVWWRVGVTTLAHVPFQGQDGPGSALLIVGTRLPGGTEELVHAMPTILEFGAFASVMVGPKLEQHNDRVRAQRRVWDVVAGGAFRPVYQPIVHLGSGRIAGFEALSRFNDGTPPAERFAEARAVGLGTVLERACVEAALAGSAGLPHGAWLSLNVGPDYLLSRPSRIGLQPADGSRPLVVELSESAAIEDYGRLRTVVEQLRADGVKIAVDDAGVGFDSLRRLFELRPDIIKLDISLIRGLDRDRVRQALVSAMVQFAGEANATLVAEGVERAAERDVLRDLGIPYGQGFLLGRPISADGDAEDEEGAHPMTVAGRTLERTSRR